MGHRGLLRVSPSYDHNPGGFKSIRRLLRYADLPVRIQMFQLESDAGGPASLFCRLSGRELEDGPAADRGAAWSTGGVGGVQVTTEIGSAVQVTLRVRHHGTERVGSI